jgi:hypothetical protein
MLEDVYMLFRTRQNCSCTFCFLWVCNLVVILREGYRTWVSENGMLRKCGRKRVEVTGS